MPSTCPKIDLMIIGAQKAGTTSLKNYLSEHPQVAGHFLQEFTYFVDEEVFKKGYDDAFVQSYTQDFPEDTAIIAKHATFSYREESLKRLKEHNPECKLVFLIRNPTLRAYSSFNMEKNAGWLKDNFTDLPIIIDKVEAGQGNEHEQMLYHMFIYLGNYAEHLARVYQYFPKNQVMVYLFEDFKKDPTSVCQDIFTHLGKDTTYEPQVNKVHNSTQKTRSDLYARLLISLRGENSMITRSLKKMLPPKTFNQAAEWVRQLNKTSSKPQPIPAETKSLLDCYFSAHNQRLTEIIDLDLSSWKH